MRRALVLVLAWMGAGTLVSLALCALLDNYSPTKES